MNKHFDLIVIGSGPAGISAAICAARQGKSVLVLERNEKPCKKIYATGNGRCNFLNVNAQHFEETLSFCKSIGVFPSNQEEGRLYPRNKEAASVVNAFVFNAKKAGVELETGFEATAVQKNDQVFIVQSKGGKQYTSNNLLVATGGKAGIQFGCYGDGFKWASQFGHNVIKPIPALCGVEIEENIDTLAGVRVFAKASLYCNDELLSEDTGEVQFTKGTVSGICVMNLARFIRKEEGKNFILSLDLYPEYSYDELLNIFMAQKSAAGCAMEGLVPSLMHDYLHERIDPKMHGPKLMASLSKDLKFTVLGTKGWKDAQVTSGGVDLDEVDDNYQSKKIDGLYFAGEVLNYDGPCGGFNIGFAIYSGMKVGTAI